MFLTFDEAFRFYDFTEYLLVYYYHYCEFMVYLAHLRFLLSFGKIKSQFWSEQKSIIEKCCAL